MNPFFNQTKEQQESLKRYIEKSQKESKEANAHKNLMSVEIIQYKINLPIYSYIISIKVLGKGMHNVRVVETNINSGKVTNDGTLKDFFCHSISINRAKEILLIFLSNWDK